MDKLESLDFETRKPIEQDFYKQSNKTSVQIIDFNNISSSKYDDNISKFKPSKPQLRYSKTTMKSNKKLGSFNEIKGKNISFLLPEQTKVKHKSSYRIKSLRQSQKKLNQLNINFGLNISNFDQIESELLSPAVNSSKMNIRKSALDSGKVPLRRNKSTMLSKIENESNQSKNESVYSSQQSSELGIIHKSPLKAIKNSRKVFKFRNVYDSFDSSDDEKDYNYQDYIPGLFSFDKQSKFISIWKTLKQPLLFIMLIYYPILLILEDLYLTTRIATIVFCFFDIFLFLNFIITFLLMPFHDISINKLNYSIKKILLYNLEFKFINFIFDFFLSLPLISIYSLLLYLFKLNLKYLKIFIVIKPILLYKFKRWIHFSSIFKHQNKNFDKKKSNKEDFQVVVQLVKIKIFLFFFLILHIVSCLWLYVARDNSLIYRIDWLRNNNLQDLSIFKLYIHSYYFSLSTLLTVGYGDIYPTNSLERVVVVIILLFGGMIYSFILTIFSSLVINKDKRNKIYQEKLLMLDNIRQSYKVPIDLLIKIQTALTYNFEHWKLDKEELISVLPGSLKVSLQMRIYENYVQKVDFLRDLKNNDNVLDNKFILTIIPLLNYQCFLKNHFLLQMNDKIEEMYFITKGRFQLTINHNDSICPLSNLSSGMHYGDILMNVHDRSPINIIVLSSKCFLLVLKKDNFIQLKIEYEDIITKMLNGSYLIHYFIDSKRQEAE